MLEKPTKNQENTQTRKDRKNLVGHLKFKEIGVCNVP